MNKTNPFSFWQLMKKIQKTGSVPKDIFEKILNTDLKELIPVSVSDKNFISPNSTPLMYIFCNNKTLKLSASQLMQICGKSDLNQVNHFGMPALFFLLPKNKSQNLNLSPAQIMQLVKKTNLPIATSSGNIILDYVWRFYHSEQLNLNREQLKEIMSKGDPWNFNYMDGSTSIYSFFKHFSPQNNILTLSDMEECYQFLELKRNPQRLKSIYSLFDEEKLNFMKTHFEQVFINLEIKPDLSQIKDTKPLKIL